MAGDQLGYADFCVYHPIWLALNVGGAKSLRRYRNVRRWLDAFPKDCLKGKRVGLFEHSAVGRDHLYDIYTGLGAEVTRLARSDADDVAPVDGRLRPAFLRLPQLGELRVENARLDFHVDGGRLTLFGATHWAAPATIRRSPPLSTTNSTGCVRSWWPHCPPSWCGCRRPSCAARSSRLPGCGRFRWSWTCRPT